MNVVGLDFGTTNVRVAFWDSDRDAWGQDDDGAGPRPQMIGEGGTSTMPSVIALCRQPGGDVSYLLGEAADQADENDTTLVIRNIKRYALSSDAYVQWHLDVRSAHEGTPQWPPTWWNTESRCVEAWGQEFPIWDLIERILDEALLRAGMESDYEWRAGCPVHAGFEYRSELARVLRSLTGKGEVTWVVEEPVLFLTLAHRLGRIGDAPLEGSYMVYDLGGGSFDCAVVEFGSSQGPMIVYGADGHPLLGGSDIDNLLEEKFGAQASSAAIRIAKESLSPTNPSVPLGNDNYLTTDDLNDVMNAVGLIDKSLMTMHDTYIASKALWKRGKGVDDPPLGEIINRNRQTGGVRFVWQLTQKDMAEDVDAVLLFGGPTRAAHVRDCLAARLGPDKVRSVPEVFTTLANLVSDLELVGVSMGACYTYQERPSPLYLSRLPALVVLEDLESGDSVQYEPFQHFTGKTFRPFDDFISEPLPRQHAVSQSDLFPTRDRYQLTIMRPGGDVVFEKEHIDKFINAHLMRHELRLVIDRYGRTGVQQSSEKQPAGQFMVFDDTPWQTDAQREALRLLFEQERRYEEERKRRGLRFFLGSPWQYPTP